VSRRSEFAVPFFALSLLLLAISLGVSALLNQFLLQDDISSQSGVHKDQAVAEDRGNKPLFPLAFAVSTVLLGCGSAALANSLSHVKRERQRPFRRSLAAAMMSGSLFVGVQSHALSQLIRTQQPEEVPTGAEAFVAVVAALHAMHFVVALLCLSYVFVQAQFDRYDHEYYWGVTFCAWFWHGLGIVWCVILVVIGLAMLA
jgi:cytochrome c oxidase subunit III